MRSEIKDLWVEAMRSGRYQQGRGCLSRTAEDSEEITYCCLGVLTDLAIQMGAIDGAWDWTEPDLEDHTVRGVRFSHDRGVESSVLPLAVAEWAGLEETNPIIHDSEGVERNLSTMNDGMTVYRDHVPFHLVTALDFEQIADLVEAQL
jgi:hypothetical protein